MRAPALRLSGRAGGRKDRRVPPAPQRHPPRARQAGGRAARAAEGRCGRAEDRRRGMRLSGKWSARRRLWLGPLAGVAAPLTMRTLWMVLCALARLWPGALAGCAEVGRCCPGRDPACFAHGWRLDRVYGTCFCDQACRLTGDCCFDYDRACPGGWLGPRRDC